MDDERAITAESERPLGTSQPADGNPALRSADPTPARMHPLTLRFAPHRERAFHRDYFRSSLRPLRIALGLGVVLVMVFAAVDSMNPAPPDRQRWIMIMRFGVVIPGLLSVLVFSFHPKFERYMQPAIAVGVLIGGLGIVAATAIRGVDDQGRYVALIVAVIFYYTFLRMRFPAATVVAWTIVVAYAVTSIWVRPLPRLMLFNHLFFMVAATLTTMFAGYFMERFLRADFLRRRALERERRRSDRLLRNILPEVVAERLKNRVETVAESFPDVTVLFADLTNFTALCERAEPADIVDLLNRIFSRFDRLAERHGLEKIKTMGDAYMVAGGLPVPRPGHCQAVADMALAMREEFAIVEEELPAHLRAKLPEGLGLRIGIHTGPVVAGVIGRRKFSYDLWGDTVNTASRMESHAFPGSIQVTRDTYERLRSRYTFEERGTIDVRGKGRLSTYLLLARRAGAGAAAPPLRVLDGAA